MKMIRKIFTRKAPAVEQPQEIKPAPVPDPALERAINKAVPVLKREVKTVERQSKQIRQALMHGALLHVYGEKK
jgi:hypothetical protein